jgi:hypothetical protein
MTAMGAFRPKGGTPTRRAIATQMAPFGEMVRALDGNGKMDSLHPAAERVPRDP